MRQEALEAIFMRKTEKNSVNLLESYSVIAKYDLEKPDRPPSSGKPKIKIKQNRAHFGDLKSSCEQLSKNVYKSNLIKKLSKT